LASEREDLMKCLLILTVGVCLLFASAPIVANQAEDEAAVKKAVEQTYASGNKHDIEAYMALCAESFESADGKIKGCAAWKKRTMDFFERQQNYRLKPVEVLDIHFVAPNVAIYKALQEVTGRVDEDGKPLPPGKNYVARVLVKEDDQWRFAALFSWPIIVEENPTTQ
jgi:ketosteroid isomerase-like protein